MGWASASQYFCVVADNLVSTGASDETKYAVCLDLISSLLDGDWDTWGEVIEDYSGDTAIIDAFRDNHCVLQCSSRREGVPKKENFGFTNSYCDQERGHAGLHTDGWMEDSWSDEDATED